MFKLLEKLQISTLKGQLFRNFTSINEQKTNLVKLNKKSFKYGQPSAETHPHLLKTGEIMPNIRINEFQTRREKLMENIKNYSLKLDKNLTKHIIVIPAAIKKYMSDKIPYVFRQNTEFLYFSGCMEPESCLVLLINENKFSSIIFVRRNDTHSELWDGPRTGVDNAKVFFGVDDSESLDNFELFLNKYAENNRNFSIWYDYMNPEDKHVDKVMRKLINEMVSKRWESPKIFMQQLRLIKSQNEVQLMQESCDIASKAITKAIAKSSPGWSEHELFALVDYECRINGAEYLAYPPVVAGGDRATIIHYINNNQIVQNYDMVLMDAGCEYHGYSSDITRTWPINHKFTNEQRILYEIVLIVQKRLIEKCHEGITLDMLFDTMCLYLGKYLQEAGLISSKTTSIEEVARMAYKFCPHHVSHYLGMDVHDTSLISRSIPLKPGMVVTVEPGVYINNNMDVPAEFHGLGVRIEDDVLITTSSPVVLSYKCPKEIDQLEQMNIS